MKFKKILILAIPFLLVSCSNGGGNTSSTSGATTTSGGETSSSTQVDPLSDEVIIPELYNSIKALSNNKSGTYYMFYESKQDTQTFLSQSKVAFKDGLLYEKAENLNSSTKPEPTTTVQYNIITKKDDKFVKSSLSDTFRYNTYYVDETTAEREIFDHYISMVENPSKIIDYTKSFDALIKYSIDSAFTLFGFRDYTQNDYTLHFQKRFNDKGEKEVFYSIVMKSDWLVKQVFEGLPLKSCGMDITFSFKDNFFCAFTMNEKLSVEDANKKELEASIKMNYSYLKQFDETLKNEIVVINEKHVFPEFVTNSISNIIIRLNGADYSKFQAADYKNASSSINQLKDLCFDINFSSSIMSRLASIIDEVDVSFKIEGEEFNVDSQISLRPYKTFVDVTVTPKNKAKCFIYYRYHEFISSNEYYAHKMFKLVDKSSEYLIETTYDGKQYVDFISYDVMELKVEDGKFDISKLDYAMFECAKYFVQ